MHILSSKNKLIEFKFQIPKNQGGFGHWIFGNWPLFVIWCLVIGILTGCQQKKPQDLAPEYAKESADYYEKAVNQYKDLIGRGNDLDKLYFELGKLYYGHGDYEEAIDAFKNSSDKEAKKLLAISYYRLGNFTDALEVFNKYEILDDEYLYYHALACEKLNLFDQALEIYKKIKDIRFVARAIKRIEAIAKESGAKPIKEASPEAYKIISEAPAKEKYPQAGALILSCDERIELTSLGTQVSQMHYIVKILNERGKEDFSETHINYDSTYEKVELVFARTIKPDGTMVDVGTRHIRDVSKYLNFPLYSNARVYIISFPEISDNAVVEYKVKIYRSQLINKKDSVLPYPVQSTEPIIAANFSYTVPAGTPLHIKTLNEEYNNFGARLSPQLKKEAGRIIYNWSFQDLPQIVPEANMSPQVQINPTLLLSTFDKWEDVYKWWWGLAKDKIKADDAIKDKVNELTQALESEEDRARAIYNFCAQNIRYVAVEYGQAGYEPHKAEDIFKNKYGDCKDQAILLVTMLKEANITAWPVLIATKEDYNLNEDFPSMLFNHCIAAASIKDKLTFLDPTAQTCSFGDLPQDDQARRVLIFKEDNYRIEDTPLYQAGHNLLRQQVKIKVNKDESINAENSIIATGLYEQSERYWLLYTTPEQVEEKIKEKIQETSIGATLSKYSVENLNDLNKPVLLKYFYSGPEYFTQAGLSRILPQLSSLDTSVIAKEKRKYPIDFGVLDTKEVSFEIEIPQGLVIKYMPDKVSEDSPWFNFSADYDFKDNKIYFKQKLELKKNTVSQEEYPAFKSFFSAVAKKIKQRIVLERLP